MEIVRRKVRRRRIGLASVILISGLLAFVFFAPCRQTDPGQNCVNQGKDCRKLATIVCWLQRNLSWNSEKEPHFLTIGKPDRVNIGLAWPPYLVFNAPGTKGRWIMLRVGFRYDCNWHGYIFPTAACKYVSKPLRY